MADDYARHALSQRAAFEATHPAVLAAAEQLANEPVLRVADLGAAADQGAIGLYDDIIGNMNLLLADWCRSDRLATPPSPRPSSPSGRASIRPWSEPN
jgi:hypothetical protein